MFWAAIHSNEQNPTEMKSYAKKHAIETCSFIICCVGHWKEMQGNQESKETRKARKMRGQWTSFCAPGVGNNRLFLQRLKSNSPHFPGWGERGFTLTGAL
jgi:glycine/D-amino acid oxidase-like deaminating enzyme